MFKFATDAVIEHPVNVRAQMACDRIAAATQGEVRIKLHPNSQLGTDTAVLEKLVRGQIDFFLMAGVVLSQFVPRASIGSIGYAFKDYGQVWPAMDGKLGAFVRAEVATRGLVALPQVWNGGFRQTTNSVRAIHEPGDLGGLRIGVPANPLWSSTFQALGASPASLDFDAVYGALRDRTVAGQDNVLGIVQESKFFEVQSFCSLTNHIWDGKWLVANEWVWRGLVGRHREVIEAEFERAALDARADLLRLGPILRGDLAAAGLSISTVDTKAFQRTLRRSGFYTEQQEKYGDTAWALLQDYVGGLT